MAVGSSTVPEIFMGELPTVTRFRGDVIVTVGGIVSMTVRFPPLRFFGPAE